MASADDDDVEFVHGALYKTATLGVKRRRRAGGFT
jgi:hypothetical protein